MPAPELCLMLSAYTRHYNEAQTREKLGWIRPMQYCRTQGLAASRRKETSASLEPAERWPQEAAHEQAAKRLAFHLDQIPEDKQRRDILKQARSLRGANDARQRFGIHQN